MFAVVPQAQSERLDLRCLFVVHSVTGSNLLVLSRPQSPHLVFRFEQGLSQNCGLRELPINSINISYVELNCTYGMNCQIWRE